MVTKIVGNVREAICLKQVDCCFNCEYSDFTVVDGGFCEKFEENGEYLEVKESELCNHYIRDSNKIYD